jgi:hypothetical protein
VIDVSGDGANNTARSSPPRATRCIAKGITINGLPIMLKRPNYATMDIELLDDLLRGLRDRRPGAFVVPVASATKFVEAIRTKLVLEIAGRPRRRRA